MNNEYLLDGMMGLIVGDAVGMPVQFEPRADRKADPVIDMRGHGCFDMPKGAWTDDSSLALATLVSIKEKGTFVLYDVADKFVQWLRDGKYTPMGFSYDIGFGCRSSITKYIRTGDPYTCGGTTERDNGNGSLMRILPTCMWAYYEMIKEKCSLPEAVNTVEQSSAITHAHKRAKMACGIYFFIVKEMLDYITFCDSDYAESENTSDRGEIIGVIGAGIARAKEYYEIDLMNQTELVRFERLFDICSFKDLKEENIRSTGYVLDSIEAAIWSLINTDNYKDCILKAVNLGDDTDSVAAIAGGLAGLFYGYESIPEDWRNSIMRKEWIEELCDIG